MKGAAHIAIPDFFSQLLEKADYKGVFGLRKRGEGKAFYSLFVDSESLNELDPFFPLMPQNAAKAVSRFTFHEPSPYKVAVILRPCELKALIELVKLEQAELDNLLIIGVECGGVLPYESVYLKNEAEALYEKYLDYLKKGNSFDNLRPVCKGCSYIWPDNADIILSHIGRERPLFVFQTERAIDLAKSLGIDLSENPERTQISHDLAEKRKGTEKALVEEIKSQLKGVEGLLSVFGKCIGCHNCSHVCPICYCKDCFFESATFDYEAESYERRVAKQGSVRVPMDTILFHLGRMTHMATSCVACGMCEDVCPVSIPVSRIFKVVGGDLQSLFEYVPGRSLDEPLPLTTFRYDELHEVEDA